MATGLAAVHNALAGRLATLGRAGGFTVSPWPDDAVPLPRMFVQPRERYIGYYDLSDADAGCPAPVLVEIVIEYPADGETGFKVMTDLLSWKGPSSIIAQIHNDPTLGGVVDWAHVSYAEWDRPDTDDPGIHRARVPVDITVTKE